MPSNGASIKDGDAYRIINRASGYALLPGNWGAGDENLMWQIPPE